MTEDKKLTWWRLMYKNFYLQMFAIAIAFLGAELALRDDFYSDTGFYIGLSIPIGVMILISYFCFYKFWKEYSKGKK